MVLHLSVGQTVEVDAPGIHSEAGLQTGDRGTLGRKTSRNQPGIMEAPILWHKNQTESTAPVDSLRVHLKPMDAPGRAKGSFGTMTALRVVLQEEQPHAIEELTRDLERARMEIEDLHERLCGRERRCGREHLAPRSLLSSVKRDTFKRALNYTLPIHCVRLPTPPNQGPPPAFPGRYLNYDEAWGSLKFIETPTDMQTGRSVDPTPSQSVNGHGYDHGYAPTSSAASGRVRPGPYERPG